MTSKPSFWQRIGLHDWFLNDPSPRHQASRSGITPHRIYEYILVKFGESVEALSFANRIVFYHEYIIVLNIEDFRDLSENKKGIFGMLSEEAVKAFTAALQDFSQKGKTVQGAAKNWVFRFVSHPNYEPGDIGFIGKLLPGASQQKENLRVTFIPRQTGVAETSDMHPDMLSAFHYYSEGYYELPFTPINAEITPGGVRNSGNLARLEFILPDKAYSGKKLEFIMKDEEVLVTGAIDTRQESNIIRIPSEWIDTPHLKLRYNRQEDQFYIASFGEKTVVNEKEIQQSDAQFPSWIPIPLNSRIILNGIIGVNLFKA